MRHLPFLGGGGAEWQAVGVSFRNSTKTHTPTHTIPRNTLPTLRSCSIHVSACVCDSTFCAFVFFALSLSPLKKTMGRLWVWTIQKFVKNIGTNAHNPPRYTTHVRSCSINIVRVFSLYSFLYCLCSLSLYFSFAFKKDGKAVGVKSLKTHHVNHAISDILPSLRSYPRTVLLRRSMRSLFLYYLSLPVCSPGAWRARVYVQIYFWKRNFTQTHNAYPHRRYLVRAFKLSQNAIHMDIYKSSMRGFWWHCV